VNIFVNKVTSASLGYAQSVFNKNSTLKATQEEEQEEHHQVTTWPAREEITGL